jgi:hypothetical protein
MNQQLYATYVVELLLREDGSVRRTRVVHIQTGAEQRWAGWDGKRLLALMSHAGPRSANNDEPSDP